MYKDVYISHSLSLNPKLKYLAFRFLSLYLPVVNREPKTSCRCILTSAHYQSAQPGSTEGLRSSFLSSALIWDAHLLFGQGKAFMAIRNMLFCAKYIV